MHVYCLKLNVKSLYSMPHKSIHKIYNNNRGAFVSKLFTEIRYIYLYTINSTNQGYHIAVFMPHFTQWLFNLPNSWPFNCTLNTCSCHILEKALVKHCFFEMSIIKWLQFFKHTWNELVFPFHPYTLKVCDGVNDKVTKTGFGT